MDKPKLYLVPYSMPPLVPAPGKNVLYFGRLWPRSLAWPAPESSPLPASPARAKLRSVPPPASPPPAKA